ncbi:MAG: hypothetical protein HY023_01195 [Chloroflexi bacterium]|nr:hypothetical protein [Chloroflexota bacterium]
MGCGSPLGDLFYLADGLLYRVSSDEWRVSAGATPGARHPSHATRHTLRAELYQMYGDGQIDEDVFTALRALADRGQLRPVDLAVHRARARRAFVDTGRGDVEITNALRGLHSRLGQLAQARAASEKVLADLEARVAGLDERIVGKEQAARDALATGSDDDVVRRPLTEKTDLAASRDRLAQQAEALRADLARLDDLRAQLEAKAAELEAVQARSRLSEEVLK